MNSINTRESQMKTLKVRLKFEPQLDCLVSFNTDTHGLKSGRQVAVRYYIEKWSRFVTSMFNKLRDKTYLRFSFDSPSYKAYHCQRKWVLPFLSTLSKHHFSTFLPYLLLHSASMPMVCPVFPPFLLLAAFPVRPIRAETTVSIKVRLMTELFFHFTLEETLTVYIYYTVLQSRMHTYLKVIGFGH